MPKRRTYRTKECTFVFNEDFTGEVHIVMPVEADGVEINGLKLDKERTAIVTVTVPFEALEGFVFHYLQTKVKKAKTNEELEEALLEPFKG